MSTPSHWRLRYVIITADDRTLMRRHFDQLRRDPHVQDVQVNEADDLVDVFDFEVAFVSGATQPQQRELHGLDMRYAHGRPILPPVTRERAKKAAAAAHVRRLREVVFHPGPLPVLASDDVTWVETEMLVQERREGRRAKVVEVVKGSTSTQVRFVWADGERRPVLMPIALFVKVFEPAGRELTPRTWQERLLDPEDPL